MLSIVLISCSNSLFKRFSNISQHVRGVIEVKAFPVLSIFHCCKSSFIHHIIYKAPQKRFVITLQKSYIFFMIQKCKNIHEFQLKKIERETGHALDTMRFLSIIQQNKNVYFLYLFLRKLALFLSLPVYFLFVDYNINIHFPMPMHIV